jgi:hypothetical protein
MDAIDLNNIHPLTDFKRNTAAFRSRLKRTGRPEVLTVEGRPALVVQDAQAYQHLLDRLEQFSAVEGIRRGLESMERGEGRDAEEFFAEMRRKLKLPARKAGA